MRSDWETLYDDLAKYALAGDSPDVVEYNGESIFPKGVFDALIQPVDGILDMGAAEWDSLRAANESLKYDGAQYLGIYEILPKSLCIYNRYGLSEDPAAMYYDGEWTWDKFAQICEDNSIPDDETYGLYDLSAGIDLLSTCGLPVTGISNGELRCNLDTGEMSSAVDRLTALFKSGGAYPGDSFPSDALFYIYGTWAVQANSYVNDFGSVASGEVMFVPLPSIADSGSSYPAYALGLALPAGAPNPDGCNALMQEFVKYYTSDEYTADRDESFRTADSRNEDMINMYHEVCRIAAENPAFDMRYSLTDDISDAYYKLQDDLRNSEPAGDITEQYSKVLNYYIKKIVDDKASSPRGDHL